MKFISLVAVAAVALPAAARAQMMPPQPPRIVTSGEAETRVAPDRASVFVGVQSRALTAAAAAADNARRQKAVIDTIKAAGIPAEQIATQSYSVSPEMRYDPNGTTPPKVTGYIVRNTVRVELKKIDQVATIIDASLAKGANEISGVQFSISTIADVRRTAIAAAVNNARADAEALASAAGGTVGALLELSTSGPMPRPMMMSVGVAGGVARGAPTPVEPGEQVVSANVSATWQFVPKPPR